MGTGLALLVGVNDVDKTKYPPGFDYRLGCCELDVDKMENILKPCGVKTVVLKTSRATSEMILAKLREAAGTLTAGDLFVFYFSGHGSQTPDTDGDEEDKMDETLIVYDRHIIDDELGRIWITFAPGVRIVMLSDSCHSGTVYKAMTAMAPKISFPAMDKDDAAKMKAQLIHFGACSDKAESGAYLGRGSVFTSALDEVWHDGEFQGDYESFYDQIVSKIKGSQVPQFHKYGPVTEAFLKSRPFQI
jgi:hypothetical protein